MSRPRTPARSLTHRSSGQDGASGGRRISGRHVLAAIGAGLLVLTLGACSDDGAQAGADGSHKSSEKAEFTDAKALGAAIDAALAKAGTAKVSTVGVSNAGNQSTGTGTVRFGNDFAFDVQTGGTLPPFRVVSVDGKLFARPVQEVKHKPWVRIDDANPKNDTAAFFGAASELMRSAIDVRDTTHALEHATTFEPTGSQDLPDGSYDTYRVTQDKDDLIASLPDETRDQAKQHLFAASMIYTIYVGDDDRPRQIKLESKLNGVPSSQTTDYTDWGTAATFAAPPADQVAELKDATPPSPSPTK